MTELAFPPEYLVRIQPGNQLDFPLIVNPHFTAPAVLSSRCR